MKPEKRPSAADNPLWPKIAVAARIVIGCVFIFSGFNKAVAPPQEFAAVIDSYYLIKSQSDILTLATVLPWAELVAGTFLLAGLLTRLASAAAMVMLSMFVYALGWALSNNIPLENCGCFGNALHVPPTFGILLDTSMILFAVMAFRWGRSRLSLDNWVDAGAR